MPKNSGIFLGLNPSRFQVHISVPDTDEECSITLDRISEYQLEFMQGAHSFVQNRPNLAKASLPCGHSFSALALLYHFANNTMACPCCRAGPTTPLAEQSIPSHLRKPVWQRIVRRREEERRQRLVEDSAAVAELIEREVTGAVDLFLRTNHVLLIVYAFENMGSISPLICQELFLSSPTTGTGTGATGTITFTSSGFCVRQLALNLSILQLAMEADAFEIVVATRNIMHGVLLLCRTRRFLRSSLGAMTQVPLLEGTNNGVQLGVECLLGREDPNPEFSRFTWTVPVHVLHELLFHGSVMGMV